MVARESTAAFNQRYGIYTVIFTAFLLAAGLLYLYNFTSVLGVPAG
jgi:hypothetical protein